MHCGAFWPICRQLYCCGGIFVCVFTYYRLLVYLILLCIPLRDRLVAFHVYVGVVSPSTILSLGRTEGGCSTKVVAEERGSDHSTGFKSYTVRSKIDM